MAIILYKKGNTAKIRGIPCQLMVCNPFSYLHLLDDGWFLSPEECYVVEEQVEEVTEDTEEETPEEAAGFLSDLEVVENEEPEEAAEIAYNAIRMKAKAAGIGHWHTKSIDRLEKELKEIEDGERPED